MRPIDPLMAVALLRETEAEVRRRAEAHRGALSTRRVRTSRRSLPEPAPPSLVTVPHCSVW